MTGSSWRREVQANANTRSGAILPSACARGHWRLRCHFLSLFIPLFMQSPLTLRASQPSRDRQSPSRSDLVTYAEDVAPILLENCGSCHRPGQPAPFDLLTYPGARKHSRDIARAAALRLMPPWPPEHGYGDFKGEKRLTEEQIRILQRWSELGSPPGDLSIIPPAAASTNEWPLGRPDLVLQPSS